MNKYDKIDHPVKPNVHSLFFFSMLARVADFPVAAVVWSTNMTYKINHLKKFVDAVTTSWIKGKKWILMTKIKSKNSFLKSIVFTENNF